MPVTELLAHSVREIAERIGRRSWLGQFMWLITGSSGVPGGAASPQRLSHEDLFLPVAPIRFASQTVNRISSVPKSGDKVRVSSGTYG